MKSFREFIYSKQLNDPNIFGQTFYDELCESFVPKETDYGTNKEMNNKKWIKDSDNVYLSFFKGINDQTYVVLYTHGIIGFGIYNSNQRSKNIDVTTLKSIEDVNKYFLFRNSRVVGSALSIFNSFIYIIIELLNKINPEIVFFKGLSPELQKLYKVLIIDKSFNNALKNNGYEYIGYDTHPKAKGMVHILKRLENENI